MTIMYHCVLLLFLQVVPLLAAGPPAATKVDASTLTGKVMCGYQGWFNCKGDGANLGWTHWAKKRTRPFAPGNVTVDLWPDSLRHKNNALSHVREGAKESGRA